MRSVDLNGNEARVIDATAGAKQCHVISLQKRKATARSRSSKGMLGRLTTRGYAGSRPVNTVQQGLLSHMRVSLLVIASKVSCLLDPVRPMMSAHARNGRHWGRSHRCFMKLGRFPADVSRGFAISVFLPNHFSRKECVTRNLNAFVAPMAAGDANIVKIFNTHRAKHSQKRSALPGLCPAVSERDTIILESWLR